MPLKKAIIIKGIKLILKVGVSSLALWYIISITDISNLWATIKATNFYLLAVALLVYIFSQLVSTMRLNTFFIQIGVKLSAVANIKLYWLGLFYNFFLPGGVGGDGYKVFLINKYRKVGVKTLIATILSDRLSGLSVIVVYLFALIYFINYSFPYQGWIWVLIPTVGAGYYLFLHVFNKKLKPIFWTVNGWSLLVQGLQMITAILILEALGAKVASHRDDFIFLFLLSSIAASVPITLGGIGARELTLLTGAKMLGLNPAHALALSLLFYSLSLFASLPGFIFTLRTEKLFEDEVDLSQEVEMALVEEPIRVENPTYQAEILR